MSAQGEGGVWLGVCVYLGVVCPGVCVCPGGVSQHALRQTPPPVNRMADRCKTLPCRNFVADGKMTLASLNSAEMLYWVIVFKEGSDLWESETGPGPGW